ncbi:MAG: TIR domain-containing protein [Clostridia bacterium]|nr:TIR domain-containing protein [Clostridia bacterium]
MKCKNCGGELYFENGVAICKVCNTNYKIDHVFEDIDVNICYIESDSNGRRTKDSIIAQELYQKLEAKKIHAFYERISAATVVGDDLQQLRYSSLHAAKVVLVVGTNVENFSAILEKYGQYLINKVVIPFYSDVKPSDIPRELSKIQALDYSSIGWEKDLERGILRVLGREKEIDLRETHNKSKRNRGILIGVGIAIILIAVAFLAFLHFNKPEEPQNSAPQTNQQMYENAQSLANAGSYLEAVDIYSEILDYKDSQEQIKSIFDRYDGYYQTGNQQFSIYFNIKDADMLTFEMTTVSNEGIAKATINSVWEGTKNTYSFTDSTSKNGTVTIVLKNDEISVTVEMEKTEETISIGNQNITFKLADKTDAPAVLQVTTEMLMSWIQTPTTAEDIAAFGFEIEKSSDTSAITIGGGVMQEAGLYKINNTDIQILLSARNISKQEVFYDYGESTDTQIVCAVFAPAEYLIPKKVNSQAKPFIDNDIFFAPGGNGMNFDWTGIDVGLSFGGDNFDYSPNGTIKSNTYVGAVCKKIVGRDFFVRTVILHTDQIPIGEMIEETDTHYVYAHAYDDVAYKIEKKSYKISETMQTHQ